MRFIVGSFLPRSIRKRSWSLLLATAIGAVTLTAAEPEPHAAAILAELQQSHRDAKAAAAAEGVTAENAVFVAFWDFDGTLLRGDCTEGLVEQGVPVYAGLAQVCIERGLSAQYPAGPDGFARFWADYRWLDERVGSWLAYPFAGQMLHGAKPDEIRAVAAGHFQHVLASQLYASSLAMLRGLEAAGVRNYVISASIDLFVDGAADCLGLPVDRLHGIELETDGAGRLTTVVRSPVTIGEGKVQKLLQIVARLQAEQPGRRVYVLAAFGNSHGTDGPFLEYTARQPLPGGRHGLAVMINGGEPPARYAGLFRRVEQRAIVGAAGQP